MTRLCALLSMPMAHPKFPNLQPFEVYSPFLLVDFGPHQWFFACTFTYPVDRTEDAVSENELLL